MRRMAVALLAAALGAGLAVWLRPGLLDRWRSPEELYRLAQTAPPPRRAELYGRLEERLPALEGFFRYQSGQGQAALAVEPHSALAQEILLEGARAARREGGDASRRYELAVALDPRPELRLEQAAHLEELGRVRQAYAVYLDLLDAYPDVFLDLRRLEIDPIQKAEDLVGRTYYADALELLGPVRGAQADRLRGLAHLGLGHLAEAEDSLEAYLRVSPQDAPARKALGDALIRQGKREEALAAYGAAATPEALLVQGQLLEAADPATAIERYRRSGLPVALWTAAGLLEELGRVEEAVAVYGELAQQPGRLADDAGYRLVVLGRRLADPSAVEAGRAALAAQPAAGHLAGLILERPLTPLWAADATPEGGQVAARVAAYRELGLEGRAHREILFAAAAARELETRLWALERLSEVDPEGAQRLAEDLLEELPSPPPALWELAYPRPFWPEVAAQAADHGVDPYLVLAVMREESRFDAAAISAAGARGLMQIMPSTGEWIAGRLGEGYSQAALFRAGTSIRFGTWYLGTLLGLFEGDPELAVAAYNAGPGSVQSWLEDPRLADPDELRRWMPFGETREYLQAVLASYRVYRALYGHDG